MIGGNQDKWRGISDGLHDEDTPEPNMVPMIDTFLFLLIFFLLTAGASQSLFDLKLPKADSKFHSNASTQDAKTKITLFADGAYAVGEVVMKNYDGVKAKLLSVHNFYKSDKSHRYTVLADKNVPVERLMLLLSFMRAEGMNNVDIVLENESR